MAELKKFVYNNGVRTVEMVGWGQKDLEENMTVWFIQQEGLSRNKALEKMRNLLYSQKEIVFTKTEEKKSEEKPEKKVKEKEEKEEESFDFDGDGDVDSKDRSLAAKLLGSNKGRKKKKVKRKK